MKKLLAAAILLSALGSPLSALAATVRWTGAAQDVRQVSTIAVSGTWATGDTATLTINNKSLTVTVGSATSTANVASILAAAVDATNASSDLVGDETKNFGGEEIPEFAELDASATGATLTLTSATPGVPFTLTRSENTAGSGALGAVTAVTAATGKNWLSNAANYSGGAVPSDDDTLVFDSGSASVLYALDHFRTNNIDLHVSIYNSYTGQIGLPIQNAGGYPEYRSRYFQFRGGSKLLQFLPGSGDEEDQGRCWIDLQDQASASIRVRANRGQATTVPTIFLAGSDASTALSILTVEEGVVELEPSDAPTSSSKYFYAQTISVGRAEGTDTALLYVGPNVRLAKANAIEVHNGALVDYAGTDDGVDDAPLVVYGGSAELRSNQNYSTIEVHSGGTVYPMWLGASGDITSFGGTVDFRRGQTGTLTGEINAYRGSAIYDPNGHGVTTINTIGCRASDLTLLLEADQEIVLNDL